MADIPMFTDDNTQNSDVRKKKGSKRSKKNWRKKADIDDVEEHLEDIRRQERTGGIVSEKPNEELFFIEREPQGQITKTNETKDSKEDVESSSEEERELILRKEKRKKKRQLAKHKERQNRLKMQKAPKNIWSSKEQNEISTEDSWIEPTLPKKPKKPSSISERPISTKAVEVCHPGASYNPDYEDHQNLLSNALKEEMMSLKKREALNKKMKFLTKEDIDKQPKWLEEMAEGLVDSKDEKPKDISDAECEDEAVISKTVSAEDRKGKRMRQKEREEKQKEKLKQEVKTNKIRLNDVYRLKSLKREIQEKDSELQEKHQRKIELNLERKNKPKRLGKLKYEDSKLDYQLSEELSGSLRGLKSEGDPLKERIKSLQKRCLIEPRRRVIPHRKYKEKFIDKRSYKKPTVKDFTSKLS